MLVSLKANAQAKQKSVQAYVINQAAIIKFYFQVTVAEFE